MNRFWNMIARSASAHEFGHTQPAPTSSLYFNSKSRPLTRLMLLDVVIRYQIYDSIPPPPRKYSHALSL